MTTQLGHVSVLADIGDGDRFTADIVVIGSGAGGSAVAGELSRLGHSVLIIEAGDLDSAIPLGEHVHTGFPAESQLESDYGPAVWSRLGTYERGAGISGLPGAAAVHSVGGLLSFWSHACPRPDYDTEGEPSIPRDELESLWDDALRQLWANTELEATGLRQRRLEAALSAVYPGLPDGRGVQPLPTAMRLREDGHVEWAGIGALLDSTGTTAPGAIRILAGHPARAIRHDGNGRATAVVASDWSGNRTVTVSGDAIVSAGGAIGAAHVLAASGIRPPALGRYVTDHTMITSRVKLAEGILDGVADDDPTFSVWIPTSTARPVHTQLARGWVTAAPFVGDLKHSATADVGQFAGVDPDPENRLEFDDDHLDAWGLPSVSARFRLSEADRARVAFAFSDHYEILAAVGDPLVGVAISSAPPGTSLHVMGTTRLGSDPESSTADSFGRVWGTENVFVAGNGVISTRNAGNPTVNTVALGIRTARAIASAGS